MCPYIVFLIFYIVYSMFYNHELLEDGADIPKSLKFIQVMLCIFCVYFLGFEFYQMYNQRFAYWNDFIWNLVDFVPPCLILYIIFLETYSS